MPHIYTVQFQFLKKRRTSKINWRWRQEESDGPCRLADVTNDVPWLSESLMMLSVDVDDNYIRKFIDPEILISF